jgi:hypothetical protein
MRPRNLAAVVVVSCLLVAGSVYGWEELSRSDEPKKPEGAETITGVGKDGKAGNPVDLHQAVTYNGASQAGVFEFRQAGYELATTLSCRGTDKGYRKMTINCKGTTKDGRPALLVANLSQDSTVVTGKGSRISEADIFGTVDDNVVFHKDCIGEGCPKEEAKQSDEDEGTKDDNDT